MAGEDRISSLPLDVIVSILSRLEVADAIRTSVLSHSWRHVWTYLPSLRIGYFMDDYETHFDGTVPVASSWIEGVLHVVSSLRGPLLHFALAHFFSSANDQSALLQRLLDLLLQKGCIETLQLESRIHPVFILLPSFRSLKELKLYQCRLVLPVDFQGCHCLSSLTLCNVQISNDDLHLLIHSSNNITTFKGGFFVPLGDQPVSIKLNSPSLRYLEFILSSINEKVEVVSAPYLEQAKIVYGAGINFEEPASVNLLFTTTAATVSSLYLDLSVLVSLSFAALPLNSTFPRVRQLNLDLNIKFMDKRMYGVFIWLLRSMLCLEELNLELNKTFDANGDHILVRDLLLKRQDGLSCLDQTLKRVRIDMDYFDNIFLTGIILVKFFLLNARVLELMEVAYWTGSDVKPSMLEKELQKAKVASSSKAKVVMSRQNEQCNC
ncbi:F-box/FBD/LRR-repeat protein [Rhynchospora pubera]|uniref:F-box/FBD/LRR-repeat protein n=1 Tax=Rhynchospora pubera TaxID=906938 RepID=A0AAV8G7C0_9POAL|nr:F-box/FBD/LRR-repeat protein [Rhynchospora pubera]